jgi:putative aminopeptidase FrvX
LEKTMPLPPIDDRFLLEFLKHLLDTPSPTGYAHQAITLCEQKFSEIGVANTWLTRKGALVAELGGEAASNPRALTAHVDTLGALVKEIKEDGRLKMSKIGAYAWNTVEGEGCTVYPRKGDPMRGSILLTKASGHVHGNEVNDLKRETDNMEVRLDARTSSEAETRGLGIAVGDSISFDPRVEVNNGFIRSRHLDDKACVASLLTAAKALSDSGLRPKEKTYFHISNYEEVGHGASAGIPAEVMELITVDMAAIGEGQASDEFHATLCIKDSGGPYHYELNQRMLDIAEAYDIPWKTDIYPYYGSDGGAYWRAGGDVAVALIGPGVDASHNYERTHMEALEATTRWILAYLLS